MENNKSAHAPRNTRKGQRAGEGNTVRGRCAKVLDARYLAREGTETGMGDLAWPWAGGAWAKAGARCGTRASGPLAGANLGALAWIYSCFSCTPTTAPLELGTTRYFACTNLGSAAVLCRTVNALTWQANLSRLPKV